MKGTVSVIIPFYNNVDWLIEAVESVLKQTYKVDEIIVINDGSKENLNKFINNYGKNIIYIEKENGGPASARNKGIEIATSEYIAFLDSDDIWEEDKLEKQIPKMINSKAIWSHTAYKTFIDGEEKTTSVKPIGKLNGVIYPRILSSCSIATPCVVIRRDVLMEDLNLRFNNSIRYGEDLYLWINLSLKYKILAVNEDLTKVRIRGNNAALSAKIQLMNRATIWELMKKNKEYYNIENIPSSIKFAYRIASIQNEIIKKFEKSLKKECYIEFISKILYVFPWIIFKVNSRRRRI